MEIKIRKNETDPDMLELLQTFQDRLILLGVVHKDMAYQSAFDVRLAEGEEITFTLVEKV